MIFYLISFIIFFKIDKILKYYFFNGKNVPCILVENKADLLNPNQINDVVALKGFANANNFYW